jgi:hypothetical protein
VDTSKNDARATFLRRASHGVPARDVHGVNADPNHITGANATKIEWLERLVDDGRITEFSRSRASEYVRPSWRHDCRIECNLAGIDEMNGHRSLLLPFNGSATGCQRRPRVYEIRVVESFAKPPVHIGEPRRRFCACGAPLKHTRQGRCRSQLQRFGVLDTRDVDCLAKRSFGTGEISVAAALK